MKDLILATYTVFVMWFTSLLMYCLVHLYVYFEGPITPVSELEAVSLGAFSVVVLWGLKWMYNDEAEV